VALRIADPRLAVRISAHLEALPEVELSSEEEEAEIVVADTVPARGEAMEVALIALVDGPEAVPAQRAGADAVLAPDASREELRLAIEAAVRGLALMPADVLGDLVDRSQAEAGDRTPPVLTTREGEVLALLAVGASNKAIARRLDISVHTAKFHVASILDKLDATGRTDAVAQGVRLGLLML
jgi:DNA-binding NarL/FixJ family response regulator